MTYCQNFYGNMDWWEVAEQPPANIKFCEILESLKYKWLESKNNHEIVLEFLEPFLKSKFLIQNIVNSEEVFETDKVSDYNEVLAYKVKLVDLDFSVGPIPLCKTEAYYIVLVKDIFKKIDLDEWQANNSFFYDAITFFWDFGDEELCNHDLSFGANAGVECIPIDSNE